jgi:hypothetical protein
LGGPWWKWRMSTCDFTIKAHFGTAAAQYTYAICIKKGESIEAHSLDIANW